MNYTPEEIAELLKERPNQPHYIIALIKKAVRQAVNDEREACAQVCDLEAATWPYPSHGNAAVTVVAAAIRARKETK